jgi:hypothetical protein
MSSAKYDNCALYDKNNNLLGLCPRKRFEWYKLKGLAKEIDENSLQLLFDPKIKNPESIKKGCVKRESICVVCGIDEELRRYHVVPLCFKKCFPAILKSHVSYDIILLCNEHMGNANYYADQYATEIFETYEVNKNTFIDSKKETIRSISQRIARKRKSDYPEKASDDIEKLTELLGHVPTDEELVELSESCIKKYCNGYDNPYEYIVKYCLNNDIEKLKEFIGNWKDVFVETMEPEFIPSDFYECC